MPSIRDEFERGAEVTRVVLEAACAPWGGSRIYIDAYEASIRIATDLQLTVAQAVRVEPIRSFAATCAKVTRDIGATQLSAARWFLEV
jgi:ribonuclease HII